MRYLGITICFMLRFFDVEAQEFTSYFTGDTTDVLSEPVSGTVLMGGATENDNAMRWFLERADGGDILVLRASGEDGYNDYFFSDLGISVNSVQTIVCNSAAASYDPYLIQQINNAEAIWFAGGDQWDYISYWRDTPVEDAINFVVQEKKITIGGTSAGSAIMGEAYFSAENGSATSSQSLNDPFNNFVTLGYGDFIENEATQDLIADTHFDNPDRRGRMIAFLARLYTEYEHAFYGIGNEEYTAVCIDENNIAHVFGSYPEYEDYVYFIQVNCFDPAAPEVCVDGEKLTWDRNDAALKVIKVGADNFGNAQVDLNDWKSTSGESVTWENWWVEDGDMMVTSDVAAIDCSVNIGDLNDKQEDILVYPNPAKDFISVQMTANAKPHNFEIFDLLGNKINSGIISEINTSIKISEMSSGNYFLRIFNDSENRTFYFVISQ